MGFKLKSKHHPTATADVLHCCCRSTSLSRIQTFACTSIAKSDGQSMDVPAKKPRAGKFEISLEWFYYSVFISATCMLLQQNVYAKPQIGKFTFRLVKKVRILSKINFRLPKLLSLPICPSLALVAIQVRTFLIR